MHRPCTHPPRISASLNFIGALHWKIHRRPHAEPIAFHFTFGHQIINSARDTEPQAAPHQHIGLKPTFHFGVKAQGMLLIDTTTSSTLVSKELNLGPAHPLA